MLGIVIIFEFEYILRNKEKDINCELFIPRLINI